MKINVRFGFNRCTITIAALTLILNMFAQQQFEYKGIVYQSAGDNCSIIGLTQDGWEGNCELPTKVSDEKGTSYIVTGVKDNAFKDCKGVDFVILPETITSIGEYAFQDAEFKWIAMYDNVKDLGYGCFMGCRNLRYVRLSKGVEWLPQYAFAGCVSLECIRIPDEMKIETYSFPGMEGYNFSGCKLKVLVMNNDIYGPYRSWVLNCEAIYSLSQKSPGYSFTKYKYQGTVFCPIGCLDNYQVINFEKREDLHWPNYDEFLDVYEFDMSRLREVMYPYWADLDIPEKFLAF